MKIIAIERELAEINADLFAELGSREAAALHELMQKDVVREVFFRADRDEAVLIMEAEDTSSAQKSLQALPFVAHGLIEFDLIPLRPYPGFKRLFR